MTPDRTPTANRYGGSLKIQVDPVVIDYLEAIQAAQHSHDDQYAASIKESLGVYLDHYQVAGMFRQLPDWARP